MNLTELLLSEVEREARITRRVLENVPEGKPDWKPHPRSMPLGYLATLCATILGWIDMMVNQPELDISPKEGNRVRPPDIETREALLRTLDESEAKARKALESTNDEHLMTNWRFTATGRPFTEQPRHLYIRDAVFQHLAHHRGQLTVYLRMNDEKVPSIYGPSADEPAAGG